MTYEEMEQIVNECEFEGYQFRLCRKPGGEFYLQAAYMEPDTYTGKEELQKTRKWLLSEHMVKSEIVQTAFKCVMTSLEHRAREGFLYKGERVFGPHFDVDALWEAARARRLDYRGKGAKG